MARTYTKSWHLLSMERMFQKLPRKKGSLARRRFLGQATAWGRRNSGRNLKPLGLKLLKAKRDISSKFTEIHILM